MNSRPLSQTDTATALRLALGPGFGFAGPTERLLNTAVSSTTTYTAAYRG